MQSRIFVARFQLSSSGAAFSFVRWRSGELREVHDLLRFLDFRPGASGPFSSVYPEDQQAVFDFWKNHFAGFKHESACAAFLRERGYEALGAMVETHGLSAPGESAMKTIEQKLLFYADKRTRYDQIVSLQERFEDFRDRYAGGRDSEQSRFWYDEVRALEVELFPEGGAFGLSLRVTGLRVSCCQISAC